MTMFDNYLMVDWSANNRPIMGENSIWLAWLERGQQVKFFNPDTRTKTLKKITELLNNKGRTIVGFDFPFGYPYDSYDGFGCKNWKDLWKLINTNIKDDINNYENCNNRFKVASDFNKCFPDNKGPFWGHPTGEKHAGKYPYLKNIYPKDYGNTLPCEFRIIEEKLRNQTNINPKPVWKLFNPPNVNGPTVGSQTLMGIPIVNKLREELDCSVWPFEKINQDPKKQFVLAEIYPSIWDTQDDHDINDANQVYTVAKNIACLDKNDTLKNLLQAPHRHPRKNDIIKKEGWILGVDKNGIPAQCPLDYIRDPAKIYQESFAIVKG